MKGPWYGVPSEHVCHWCLHFEGVILVEVPAYVYVVGDLGSDLKGMVDTCDNNELEVALGAAGL